MTVILRPDPAPDGATLLIHMGVGAVDTAVDAAMRNYGEYRSLASNQRGIFTVSVFAATGTVTESAILAALPQRSFGRSTVEAIHRAGFDLLATSIDDPDMAPSVAAIQSSHFDVVLPHPGDPRLTQTEPLDDEDLEAAMRVHLVPHVELLLTLFEPRQRK